MTLDHAPAYPPAHRVQHQRPEVMDPAERLREIGAILAAGYRRARNRLAEPANSEAQCDQPAGDDAEPASKEVA